MANVGLGVPCSSESGTWQHPNLPLIVHTFILAFQVYFGLCLVSRPHGRHCAGCWGENDEQDEHGPTPWSGPALGWAGVQYKWDECSEVGGASGWSGKTFPKR